LPAPRLLRRGTGRAEVVHVVRILDETVVDVVADLPAGRADEVDALDRLVDALPVEDPPPQLLDPDAEQLFVLPLDLAAPGLVLRELLFGLVSRVLLVFEHREALRRLAALVALSRTRHARRTLRFSGFAACSRNS